ncbi:uncharacterized protein LOC125042363 isoform X2 [Penaeus chinensis]|uniref:uncharacterized protein LOC125042363 isoform X2 n=1 Tax=Penaeus chinensis TaxID=139456 RepID=UPI001FB635CE|nr:uncharacterized protein LOC125042363 isoform X2 [Penaeus chinensis]
MRRRLNSRAFDPFDEWLETQGLYRKQVARDGSCLFRAVAEQVIMSQTEHVRVRSMCLEYMMLYKEDFQPFLDIPLDHHVFNLQDVREWGGHTEILAMSRLFKVDFLIYQGIGRAPCKATDYDHPRTLMLSFTNGNHYDIVYKKDHASSRGFCQSVVYDILYSRVFKLKDVRLAVDTMLHDKEYATLRRDSANSAELKEIGALVEKILGTSVSRDNSQDEGDKNTSTEERHSLEDIHPDDVKGLLAHGIPPFPYKVAKSLDPDIYRNIEYDAWNTVRREARYGPFDSNGFQAGVKVLIKLELLPNRQEVEDLRKAHIATRQGSGEGSMGKATEERVDVYRGHIQEMSENKGPVDVYIEEIGSRLKVPYDSLEKVPPSPPRSPWHAQMQQGAANNGAAGTGGGVIANYKNLSGYYKKSTLPPESEFTVTRSKKKGGKQSREVLTFIPINTSLRYCTPPSSTGMRGRGAGSPSAHGSSPRSRTPQGSQSSYNKNYPNRGVGRGNSSNYRNNESPAREAFPPFAGAVNVGMSVEGVWAVRPNTNQSNHLPPPPQSNMPGSSNNVLPSGPYCPSASHPAPMPGDDEPSRSADISQLQMRAVTEALQQVMSAGGQEVRVTGQQLEVVSTEERAVPQADPLVDECPQVDNTDTAPQVEQNLPEPLSEQKGNETGTINREIGNTGPPVQGANPHTSPAMEEPSLQIETINQTQYMHPANGEMQPAMYTQLAGSPSPHNGAMYTISYPPPYPSPGLFQVFTPVPDSSGTPEFTPPPPVTSMPSRPDTWDGQGQADAESMKVNQGMAPVMVYHMPVMFGGYDYSYNPWAYPVPVMPSPPMEMVPPPPMGAPPHQNYPPPYHHDGREGRERPPFHLRGRGRGGSPHHNQYRGHHQNNQPYNSYPGNSYHGGQNHYNNSYGSPMGRGSGPGGQRSLPPRFQRGGGTPRHQYSSPNHYQHPNTPPHLNQRSHQYEGQPLMHMGSKSNPENLSSQVVSGGTVGSGGLASPPLVTYVESDRSQGMLPLPPQDGPPIPPQEPVPMAAPPPYPTPPGFVMSGPWMWKMM